MKNEILEVRIGSRLYYTDSKDYVGEVVKILKRTVWYKDLNGNITKNFSLNFAKDMLNSFDEHILDLEKKYTIQELK
jgi:hypothetical protein